MTNHLTRRFWAYTFTLLVVGLCVGMFIGLWLGMLFRG
jgi:ABC-type dipeptide/oligopeptide/nickel transport system permease component